MSDNTSSLASSTQPNAELSSADQEHANSIEYFRGTDRAATDLQHMNYYEDHLREQLNNMSIYTDTHIQLFACIMAIHSTRYAEKGGFVIGSADDMLIKTDISGGKHIVSFTYVPKDKKILRGNACHDKDDAVRSFMTKLDNLTRRYTENIDFYRQDEEVDD